MATITRRTLVQVVRRYSRVSHQLKLRTGVPTLSHARAKLYNSSGLHRMLSTQAEANVENPVSDDTISEKRDFQAETRMLLDIVAKSLYSNNEVFLRELISNASDALEKLRYTTVQEVSYEEPSTLEIKINTNKQDQLLIIEDNGIGMTKEELIANLGTIARSGSKAFLEELKNNKSTELSSIIGQFGVGFYSCFIVAKKVEVYSRARQSDAQGYCWSYDGSGQYEIRKADDLPRGTKIVVHLKPEHREYADDDRIRNLIKKYSNFINFPILVNNEKCNVLQPLWLMEPKEINDEEYTEFYRFVSNSFDKPRYRLHYRTDAPMAIKALLYVPTVKPTLTEMNRDLNVSLYTKRVLIKNKANEILPEWCGFLTGIVDCEDIPLNLSRELLQNSPLIAKLRTVLTNRVIKFLSQCAQKAAKNYDEFHRDYHMYLKAGVLTTEDHATKEEIAKLLRFETSNTQPGETKSLTQYLRDLPNEEEKIYYLFAPSRALALSSPYYETLKKKGLEVVFVHELFDEHIFMSLQTFRTKKLVSAEDEVKIADENIVDLGEGALRKSEMDALITWAKDQLKGKAANVKITNKLDSHPCVVTVENMGAARHLLKMQQIQKKITEEMRDSILAPCLELNPKHPVIKKLSILSQSNPELASLLVRQLFYNAMLAADLVQDASNLLINMNDLLSKALEKY